VCFSSRRLNQATLVYPFELSFRLWACGDGGKKYQRDVVTLFVSLLLVAHAEMVCRCLVYEPILLFLFCFFLSVSFPDRLTPTATRLVVQRKARTSGCSALFRLSVCRRSFVR